MASFWFVLLFGYLMGDASMSPAGSPTMGETNAPAASSWLVRRTSDFEISGEGSNAAWERADWLTLPPLKNDAVGWTTLVRILYSDSGLYVLFRFEDHQLTATMETDFLDLWNEDVAEVFLWPDERYPIYFEYEISPLNRELVLLVPNLDGEFLGWLPWHYEGARRTRHATTVWGGKKESLASIEGWSAEIFIPFDLLAPLANVPPRSGTRWRANFYRCDYDHQPHASWAWQPVEKRFHEYKKFGQLIFE
jgi:hypothetical protein